MFEYMCDYDDLADSGIEFQVMDQDVGAKDDYMGYARINTGKQSHPLLNAVGEEVEAWNHLISNPNGEWKDFELPLRLR